MRKLLIMVMVQGHFFPFIESHKENCWDDTFQFNSNGTKTERSTEEKGQITDGFVFVRQISIL